MKKQVEHAGFVCSIHGNTMMVRIAVSSACSGCATKKFCFPSESKNRDIPIEGFSGDFVLGEQVKIVMRQSLGFQALWIGYIIPFVVVLVTLLVAYQICENELVSGLSALLALIPYYLIIKLMYRKIAKSFSFSVQKLNME